MDTELERTLAAITESVTAVSDHLEDVEKRLEFVETENDLFRQILTKLNYLKQNEPTKKRKTKDQGK